MTPRKKKTDDQKHGGAGFSLIEVLLGIALIGVAMIGLAQLFLLGLANNARSDQISNATFLAQQQVDQLRSLTADELTGIGASPLDEMVDVNNDGQMDYRRITRLTEETMKWRAEIWVFSAGQSSTPLATLINDPMTYRVRAELNTVISR